MILASTMRVACTLAALAGVAVGVTTVELPISARSAEVESDWTAVYYGHGNPLLIGNDGGAASGGFRTFSLDSDDEVLSQTSRQTPGRTKLVATVYGLGGHDLIVTIAQPDSLFRLYDARNASLVGQPEGNFILGDWSALCSWKSRSSGAQYLFLFGKGVVKQFLLREKLDGETGYELLEIKTFDTPVEASSCAVSQSALSVYFSGDDDTTVYSFPARESTTIPEISIVGHVEDDVTGLATYATATKANSSSTRSDDGEDYLFVAQEDTIGVYDTSLNLLGTLALTGDEDIEVKGLNVYQGEGTNYPAGFLTYALESDSLDSGFGVSSLAPAFAKLNLTLNTEFDPSIPSPSPSNPPICPACSSNGFCASPSSDFSSSSSCSCFPGFTGPQCESFTCNDGGSSSSTAPLSCSGHGECIGPNICRCHAGWGKDNSYGCSFKAVEPLAETDSNGEDGDDPAIWIHPHKREQSRIITTTKSEVGAGLGVFDLEGNLLQTIDGEEPNNVDVIYGFPLGSNGTTTTIDLAYAACRGDNTLCLFEITVSSADNNETLKEIAGGKQELGRFGGDGEEYEVYGSCTYRSRKNGKQYLFVNSKTAEYLQYELKWDVENQALQTTFVRNFTGGTGGQVEGCVSDEGNGWVLIGEEPYGLWRYGAEPEDDVSEGILIDSVDEGMFADVEGVTLVEGATADEGFILVSMQGVSAYNVYRRAPPHEFVETFTIYDNREAGIDGVSNTDGIAAVSTALGDKLPHGLVVVHDDANQLPGGGTSDQASFKLVSLGDVLGADLLKEVDPAWNPRGGIQ